MKIMLEGEGTYINKSYVTKEGCRDSVGGIAIHYEPHGPEFGPR